MNPSREPERARAQVFEAPKSLLDRGSLLKAIHVALIFAIAGFSGCFGAGAAPKAADSTTAPAPVVNDDTGSIAGLVVDEEHVAIQGADVGAIGKAGVAAKTDSAGRFTLNELTPGTYGLIAQKLGYDAATRQVSVQAGKVSSVNLTLVTLAVGSTERHELIPYNGYLNLGGSVGVREVVATTVYDDNDMTKMYFETNVTKGLTAVVDGMRWGSAAPLTTKWFMLDMLVAKDRKNRTSGPSPLVERLDDLEISKKTTIGHQAWVAWGSTSEPTSAVVLVYQQKFELYATIFYGGPAPGDYNPFPA